jgi:hypothetical protein
MATEAQINANRENAQHSSGPHTEEGKANSSKNNFRHGFRGQFAVLPTESQEEFDLLLDNLRAEHKPQCTVEDMLILKMAQHFWLSQRAQLLADLSMDPQAPDANPDKLFPLWLRYQTTNDRGFHKCLDQLIKLRAQRFKEAIGFERQNRQADSDARKQSRDSEAAVTRQAVEERKQATETRKQDLHQFNVLLAQAKLDHQALLNLLLDRGNPLASAAIDRIIHAEKAQKAA